MQFYEINICQIMIFRLYIVYNKHDMIKICYQIRENSQIISQVLEWFCCRLYRNLWSVHKWWYKWNTYDGHKCHHQITNLRFLVPLIPIVSIESLHWLAKYLVNERLGLYLYTLCQNISFKLHEGIIRSLVKYELGSRLLYLKLLNTSRYIMSVLLISQWKK